MRAPFYPDQISLRHVIVLLAIAWLPKERLLVSASEPELPNVIVVYTDDQGFGDASCLNPKARFQTPNIDRLAKEGVTFLDGHSSDTVCTPSRYGLLTGRYSWRTELKAGVFGAERKCLIEDGQLTLASMLRAQGYRTAMVGKWHLGMDFPGTRGNRDWSQPVRDMPLDKGFDYFWGIPASMNYGVLAWFEQRHAKVPPTMYTSKKPNDLAISDYRIQPPYLKSVESLGTVNQWGVVRGPLEVAPDFVDSECLQRFTNQSIKWIRQHTTGEHRNQPFFLYLAYTSPHKPVIPIEAFRGKSQAGAYGDFMMETDAHVGSLLGLLDELQLTDNTMVVYTSDNGPENTWRERARKFQHQSNFTFRDGKRSIYEGGHRVPFIVRWPAKVAPNRRSNQLVCQTDVLATLADITGAAIPNTSDLDSVSFLPALIGPETSQPRPALIHHSAAGGFAIRDGDWKLILQGKRQPRDELYNLKNDPGERNNVLADHPDIVNTLRAKFQQVASQ